MHIIHGYQWTLIRVADSGIEESWTRVLVDLQGHLELEKRSLDYNSRPDRRIYRVSFAEEAWIVQRAELLAVFSDLGVLSGHLTQSESPDCEAPGLHIKVQTVGDGPQREVSWSLVTANGSEGRGAPLVKTFDVLDPRGAQQEVPRHLQKPVLVCWSN